MADSIRQQIIDAIDTRLKTILVVNGYKTNAGQHVYEWRETPLDESLLPAIVYRDVNCDNSFMATGVHFHKMNMEIEVVCAAGTTTPAGAREIIADVVKAIGTDIEWGNLAINTYPGIDEMQVEQNDKKIAGILMRFEIHFRTKEWDPYTRI